MRKRLEPNIWWALALSAIIVIAWGVNWYVGINTDQKARGINGDMFGAVNSLFTGFAFAAVIFAILVRRYEVYLLQKEIKRSKLMMEDQAAAIHTQNVAARKKSFEDTFFQMLNMHNVILNSIDIEGGKYTGRDVFEVMIRRLSAEKWDYDKFYNRNGKELGHYFRVIYNIF